MMRKFFLIMSFMTLTYLGFGLYLALFDSSIFKEGSESQPHPYYHDYRGVSHVVTSFGKGSMTPSNILIEAAESQLDFVFFTDLNLTDRPYNLSGYHGDIFTFSNQKVSYLDSHILIYSKNPDFYFDSLSSAHAQLHHHFSEQRQEQRHFLAVLAHPLKKHHLWSGDYPPGLDGIEVINLRQLWQEGWHQNKANFIWSLFTFPFNPKLALLRLIREPKKELKLWDELNSKWRTLGFLGNETTARIFKVLGLNFTFLSYEKSFQFASNHILLSSELTSHAHTDRSKIFQAIERGQFYFAYDSLGSPLGFASYLQCGKQRYLPGSEVDTENNCSLKTDLPKNLNVPHRVEVYRNGEIFFTSNSIESEIDIKQPGHYRVVVKIQPRLPLPDQERWYGWIYTNPFYIITD